MFGRKENIDEEFPVADYSISGLSGLAEFPANFEWQNTQKFKDIFDKIREELFLRLAPSEIEKLPAETLSVKITNAVSDIADELKLQLNWREQSEISRQVLNDLIGLGPIQELLKDESVSDVLVNGPDNVFVERNGVIERTDFRFRDESHVLNVAKRIAESVGRRVDEASPMVDARLEDGSRVNVIIPPLSIKGTTISIRKFSTSVISLDDMRKLGTLSSGMSKFLKIGTASRLNIIVSGGTGAGKTSLLNAMSQMIDSSERIVTIEDAAELRIQSSHVISLETRENNTEGAGKITERDLLRNALRMRPDRILLGEVRGAEVFDMLQAMNTGHDGSMSSLHANSARDALVRLENMYLAGNVNVPLQAIRRQIVQAIDLVVHIERMRDGVRRITNISEIAGLENDVITLQPLFEFKFMHQSEDGKLLGEFVQEYVRPSFYERFEYFGYAQDFAELLEK